MLRAWRRTAVCAVVTGAAIAAQLAVMAPAQAATPTISIAATSRLKPVTGDVLVVYHAGAYGNATLHGTISGGAAGEVAVLYAQQFPYKSPAVRVGSVTLKAAKKVYAFTVTPILATHYAVKLFASGTATAPIATSAARALYVADEQTSNPPQKCGRPVCHETYHIDTFVPPSALGTEMAKRGYFYFGLSLGTSRIPAPPKWLYLYGGHPHVTKSRRISAGEFENTLTFSFTIGNHSYYFLPNYCTKDALATDGIGLPGHHSCGVSKIPSTLAYLG
jgi:hypothetical protein